MTVTFSLLQQLLLPFEYLFTIDISCYSATCYLLQWLLFLKLYSCFFLSFPFPSLGSPVESLFCSFYVFIVGYFGCAELLEEKKEKKRRESTFSSEKSENRASASRQPRPCAAAAPFFSSTEQKHSGNHKEFIFKKSQCSACIIKYNYTADVQPSGRDIEDNFSIAHRAIETAIAERKPSAPNPNRRFEEVAFF